MPAIDFDTFASHAVRIYRLRPRGTRLKVAQALDVLASTGSVRTTADLTTAAAADFVAAYAPGRRANTVIGLLSYLKALCNLAVEEGWLERAPAWRRVWPRPSPPCRARDLGRAAVGRLLAHLAARPATWEARRLHALVSLVAYTGVRRCEALLAGADQLDLGRSLFLVRPAPGGTLKTAASAAAVPLPDAAADVLRDWLPCCRGPWLFPGVRHRGPWAGGAAGSRAIDHLKRSALEVGIPWISWHALRHTFATACLGAWGVPLWAVQRVLRHTSSRTTEGYLHLDGVDLLVPIVRGLSYRPSA